MEFSVRVLGIHEDDQWCAIALEMSLRGYGDTFEEALGDLKEAIEAQVSFAIQHETLDTLWTPAEPQYIELYQRVRHQAMRRYLQNLQEPSQEEEEYAASDMPLPRADRNGFEIETAQ